MCVLLYAGTGISAGTKSPSGIGDGGGRLPVVVCGDGDGENPHPPCGDGDGGLFLGGEFPVAIFSCSCRSGAGEVCFSVAKY